jgi:hypothetical protein
MKTHLGDQGFGRVYKRRFSSRYSVRQLVDQDRLIPCVREVTYPDVLQWGAERLKNGVSNVIEAKNAWSRLVVLLREHKRRTVVQRRISMHALL